MDLAAAFVLFGASMFFMLSRGYSMCWGVLIGWAAFLGVGLRRGFSLRALLRMSLEGTKSSLVVTRTLLVIGVLTGVWRAGGTFTLLVVWGLKLLSPSTFVLAAYLLCAGLSYAIGTSFGVAGTLGVALMTLARAGGANELATAGAILSGLYFGNRCSPASGCALMVASMTGTRLYDNVRLMLKTAALPVLCCAGLYAWLSLKYPLSGGAAAMIAELAQGFNLNPWTAFPAVVMLVLPLFRMPPDYAFLLSIAAAFACALGFQGMGAAEALRCAVMGYRAAPGSPAALFNGGGLVSMVGVCAILFISGSYSGIFEGTGMLDGLHAVLGRLMKRWGAFTVQVAAGLAMNAVFCNQTVGAAMTIQLTARPYSAQGRPRRALAEDVSNSAVVMAALVPWNIACSVPLGMFGVPSGALRYAYFLYLMPLLYAASRRHWLQER